VTLGALQAWREMQSMTGDGLAYLDIADAYLKRDWASALNAYWSPLYSWLLALALAVARPSRYWEFAVAHAVNFVIYIGAAASFEFMLAQLMLCRRKAGNSNGVHTLLPEWVLAGFCYLVFLWSSLQLISLKLVSPDMCVAAVAYLAVGILFRTRTRPVSLPWSALLGLVLGVGYLAKTVMLPLAFGFLAVALTGPDRLQKRILGSVVALVTLCLVALPFATAISRAKGRLTFGESGRLNYIWFVNGDYARYGPIHHPRELLSGMGVFHFAGPVAGTQPSGYDPSYWMEGLRPRVNAKQQLSRLIWSINDCWAMFVLEPFGVCLLTCLCIFLLGGNLPLQALRRDVRLYLPLIVPGALGLLAYALVLVEIRYVAPFAVLVAVSLFSCVRVQSDERRHLPAAVLAAAAVILAASLQPVNVLRTAWSVVRVHIPQHLEWETARLLLRSGVRQGDQVGIIARRAYWARIAGVRVATEMRPDSQLEQGHRRYDNHIWRFWMADRKTRQRVLDAMAGVGVAAVVADQVPPLADTTGWTRLGSTDRYVWLAKRRS